MVYHVATKSTILSSFWLIWISKIVLIYDQIDFVSNLIWWLR